MIFFPVLFENDHHLHFADYLLGTCTINRHKKNPEAEQVYANRDVQSDFYN